MNKPIDAPLRKIRREDCEIARGKIVVDELDKLEAAVPARGRRIERDLLAQLSANPDEAARKVVGRCARRIAALQAEVKSLEICSLSDDLSSRGYIGALQRNSTNRRKQRDETRISEKVELIETGSRMGRSSSSER